MKKCVYGLMIFFFMGCVTTKQETAQAPAPQAPTTQTQPPAKPSNIKDVKAEDQRECAKNFTMEGSVWSGRTFKTNQFLKGKISMPTSVENASKFIMSKGWTIQSAIRESGLISATMVVGKGRTLTMNVAMTSKKEGLDIFITSTVPGGVGVNGNEVKDEFCGIISAAQPAAK